MKKTVAFVLSVFLLLGCMTCLTFADGPAGTAITDVQGLMDIKGANSYYLANDILISGTYESPKDFSGTLDGQGHTIVLDGATVTGGLFNHLNGATVKNLNITEGEKANNIKMRRNGVDSTSYLVGAVADSGFGVVDHVVAKVNIDISLLDSTTVGGMVGTMQDGALTVTNCINIGNLTAGRYAAGMVGMAVEAATYNLVVDKCVNYGKISGKYSAAGIAGQNNGNTLGVSVTNCVNYGDVSNASGNQAGGIMAFAKPNGSQGIIRIENNINYGRIHNTNEQSKNGQISGILTRLNRNSGTLSLKGNINYGNIGPDFTFDPEKGSVAAAIAVITGGYHADACIVTDNYTVAYTAVNQTIPAGGTGTVLDDSSFAALNEKFPDVFVQDTDGKIALKWMQDASLGATAPSIVYNVDGQEEIKVPEVTAPGTSGNNSKPSTPTAGSQNTDQPEPSGETSGEGGDEKKGCASSVGVSSAIVLVTVVTTLGMAVLKKQKIKK